MNLDTILIRTSYIISSALLAQPVLKEAYVSWIHKRHREGKLDKLPLYAQELNDSITRSLERIDVDFSLSEVPSLGDRAKTLFYYEFTEFPTFKALYRFITLDNPEFRSLF